MQFSLQLIYFKYLSIVLSFRGWKFQLFTHSNTIKTFDRVFVQKLVIVGTSTSQTENCAAFAVIVIPFVCTSVSTYSFFFFLCYWLLIVSIPDKILLSLNLIYFMNENCSLIAMNYCWKVAKLYQQSSDFIRAFPALNEISGLNYLLHLLFLVLVLYSSSSPSQRIVYWKLYIFLIKIFCWKPLKLLVTWSKITKCLQ